MQAPAAPPGNEAQNYYPFLDFAWGNCTVEVSLGPTHWSDNSQVHHGVLQLVCTHPCNHLLALCMLLRPFLNACCRGTLLFRCCPQLAIVRNSEVELQYLVSWPRGASA